MKSNMNRFYIIERSDGSIWHFSYNETIGIIYRIFSENSWSNYQLAADNSTENFSVILFSNDTIYVLYQDINEQINLSIFDDEDWHKQQILKNMHKGLFVLYFKAIVAENQIHIIYSILNKKTGIVTIFNQTLDDKNNLSSPNLIDTIKFNHPIPFNVYISKSQKIFIVYQKLINNYKLGYKIFNKWNKNWSNFYVIDTSSFPYKDYSMIIDNDKIHFLYIKNEQSINSVIYAIGDNTFKYNTLFENSNINSCSFFIAYKQIWCSWIQNDKLLTSFSIDSGITFSSPPYNKSLISCDIIKCIYISNKIEYMKNLIFNELYIKANDPLNYLIISDVYSYNNTYNNLSCISYFMNNIFQKLSTNEILINKKDKFIVQLKYMLEEQKTNNVNSQFSLLKPKLSNSLFKKIFKNK